GQLAEQILIARKENSYAIAKDQSIPHAQLMSLVNFYSERGAYQRIVETLDHEREHDQWRDMFSYRQRIAEYARLIWADESELKVLREEFNSRTGNLTTANDPLIERYFEALLGQGDAGRAELLRCVRSKTPHRFQLISFLLKNNELKLAREAVEG